MMRIGWWQHAQTIVVYGPYFTASACKQHRSRKHRHGNRLSEATRSRNQHFRLDMRPVVHLQKLLMRPHESRVSVGFEEYPRMRKCVIMVRVYGLVFMICLWFRGWFRGFSPAHGSNIGLRVIITVRHVGMGYSQFA